MYFMIYCEDAPRSFEKRRTTRPAHLQHLEKLKNDQRLLTAGPVYHPDADHLTPNHIMGSLIIGDFTDIDAARAWAAADPYATAEVFAKVTILPYLKVI
jgi:uncharacterized protein YciI